MVKVRTIYYEKFLADITHIYQDDNHFCVRVLNMFDGDESDEHTVLELDDLNTTERIANESFDSCIRNCTNLYKIKDVTYYVAAEFIFDKTVAPYCNQWKPCANIIFYCDESRILKAIDCGLLSAFSKDRIYHHIRINRQSVVAQIFCKSSEDSIINSNKSLTARPNSLYGNVNLGDATNQTPDEISVLGSSRFLNVRFKLTAPEYVKPNEEFDVQVESVSGEWANGDPAQHVDVNFNNFDIEAVDGFVPRRRVALVNGYGSFRAIALHLKDGEEMRIKINRKYYTGYGECIVKVRDDCAE